MTKRSRPWNPSQAFLLPPSPTEWLPEGHLAYFILDVVEKLDLRAIEAAIAAKDPRGERPYSARMLVALLLYGYSVGVFSSRKLARATYEDVALRVLSGGTHPHFTTINQFRLAQREALAGLFLQVLRLCQRAGLVKLGHVAIDGSKVLANASKHKAMSYARMQDEEARLRGEINELLANADAADRADDERFGAGVADEDLPEELRRREQRLARIEAAMAELQREAAQARAEELRAQAARQRLRAQDPSLEEPERRRAATRAAKSDVGADEIDPHDDEDDPPSAQADLPHHRVPTDGQGKPAPKAQRNFTDPDSRIMVTGKTYVQAYNAQIAVDEHAQIIVAHAVTNQPPDQQHLVPMVDRVVENVGKAPKHTSADNGYYSDGNVKYCESVNTEPYIATGRTGRRGSPERLAGLSGTNAAMRAKLDSSQGRAVYSRRKVIVEPAFGQIKGARGFRRFSLRSLVKVRFEWAWVSTAHNLLKLYRAGQGRPLALQPV